MKLKTKLISSLFAVFSLSAASLSAQTIVTGTTMTFDFGTSANSSTAPVNNVAPSTPASLASGSLSTITDSTGATLTGVGLAWTTYSPNGFANNDAQLNSNNIPSWVTPAIADGWLGSFGPTNTVCFTLTLSGLNTSLAYNLTMGAGYSNDQGNTDYRINGTTISQNGHPLSATNYVTFSTVTAPTGTIVIEGLNRGTSAVISGLQVVAIPEPSSALLGGLGALALLRRRR